MGNLTKKSLYYSRKIRYYKCKLCNKNINSKYTHEQHMKECCSNYVENVDYVECKLCPFMTTTQMIVHVKNFHNLSKEEYEKQHGQLTSLNYKKIKTYNSGWIGRLTKDEHEAYLQRLGDAVSKSIMVSSKERERRSNALKKLNKTIQQRDIASKTAKKTSSNKDILLKRSERLKSWRQNNPELFFNKCVSKLVTSFHSKPEKILFNWVKNTFKQFIFKQNQFVKDDLFTSKTKRKQLDICDIKNKIIIEFDGFRHFKDINNQLKDIQLRDQQLNKFCLNNNFLLIRVDFEQFSYKENDFSSSCKEIISLILKNKFIGLFFIGQLYDKKELFVLLRTIKDQNILWMYLLQNKFNYHWDIAVNPNCPFQILKILSKSEEWLIRERVAYNKNCSIELLEQLSNDKYYEVRQAVVYNKFCSLELLEKLSKDKHCSVAFNAQEKLNEKRRDL